MSAATNTRRSARLARLRRQLGIGLIELMVAVTIGMVLIAGALAVFVNSRQTYTVNQEISRLLENANYAMDTIGRSLELAGYWGRNNTDTLVRRRSNDPEFQPLHQTVTVAGDCEGSTSGWFNKLSRRVEGLDNTNTAFSTCIPNGRYQASTDILVVRHAEPEAATTLSAGQVYVRSDPAGAELFVGTTAPTGFTDIAANFELRAMAFYVSPYHEASSDNMPTLKVAELGVNGTSPAVISNATPTRAEVVIPGVENLQVQFGVDTSGDGSANKYVDADGVAADEWDDVAAVRLWLLVRAENPERGYRNENTYTFPDVSFTPRASLSSTEFEVANMGDYRRLLVSRTVRLRN